MGGMLQYEAISSLGHFYCIDSAGILAVSELDFVGLSKMVIV